MINENDKFLANFSNSLVRVFDWNNILRETLKNDWQIFTQIPA